LRRITIEEEFPPGEKTKIPAPGMRRANKGPSERNRMGERYKNGKGSWKERILPKGTLIREFPEQRSRGGGGPLQKGVESNKGKSPSAV